MSAPRFMPLRRIDRGLAIHAKIFTTLIAGGCGTYIFFILYFSGIHGILAGIFGKITSLVVAPLVWSKVKRKPPQWHQ